MNDDILDDKVWCFDTLVDLFNKNYLLVDSLFVLGSRDESETLHALHNKAGASIETFAVVEVGSRCLGQGGKVCCLGDS